MRNRTSDLWIPCPSALTTEPQRLHGERGLLCSSYDTCPTYCKDQQCGLFLRTSMAYFYYTENAKQSQDEIEHDDINYQN